MIAVEVYWRKWVLLLLFWEDKRKVRRVESERKASGRGRKRAQIRSIKVGYFGLFYSASTQLPKPKTTYIWNLYLYQPKFQWHLGVPGHHFWKRKKWHNLKNFDFLSHQNLGKQPGNRNLMVCWGSARVDATWGQNNLDDGSHDK